LYAVWTKAYTKKLLIATNDFKTYRLITKQLYRSVDYVDTTTGISAAESVIDGNDISFLMMAKPADFRRAGAYVPRRSSCMEEFSRNGHTEATVDLMRFSRLKTGWIYGGNHKKRSGTMPGEIDLLDLGQRA